MIVKILMILISSFLTNILYANETIKPKNKFSIQGLYLGMDHLEASEKLTNKKVNSPFFYGNDVNCENEIISLMMGLKNLKACKNLGFHSYMKYKDKENSWKGWVTVKIDFVQVFNKTINKDVVLQTLEDKYGKFLVTRPSHFNKISGIVTDSYYQIISGDRKSVKILLSQGKKSFSSGSLSKMYMKNTCKNAPSLIKASIFSKNKQGLGFTLDLEDIELMCFRRLHRHQENLIKEKKKAREIIKLD